MNFPNLQFGVHLPHLGRHVDPQELIDFAQQLERLGVHSAWVSDHVCWPREIDSKYPYTDDGSFGPSPDMVWLDPLHTLTFVAAHTSKLKLGTTVLILPYRPPVTTAKQLATMDVLSNGRLIVGVGVGWMREEAEILGMPWEQRGQRADEQLAMFDVLFNESEPEYAGRFYTLPKVGFEPKPIQKPLPIWVGGSTSAAFKRVARFGTGFHAAFEPLDNVTAGFNAVKEEAEKLGRDPANITLSLRTFLDPASAMDPAKSIGGDVSQMQEGLAAMENAGISHILLDPVARGGVQGRLAAITEFMENVA